MAHHKKAAFLSYASEDEMWAEILRKNLERSLEHLGDEERAQVFDETVDVGAGHSWVTRVNQGLSEANWVLLVVTPEALAAPGVAQEWETRIPKRDDWDPARLVLVKLRPTPLPPMLDRLKEIDFQDHDREKYLAGLGQLLGVLLKQPKPYSASELPSDLEVPEPAPDPLGTEIRERAVAWLAEYLEGPDADALVEREFELGELRLAAYPSRETAAAAAVVRVSRGQEKPRAVLRLRLSRLRGRRTGRLQQELEAILEALAAAEASSELPPPLRGWLDFVAQDCKEMESFGPEGRDWRLLEPIYVDLVVSRRQPKPNDPDWRILKPIWVDSAVWRRKPGSEASSERERGGTTQDARVEEVLGLSSSGGESMRGRWVILGEPGAGKTTILRHLAYILAVEPAPSQVPVFVRLPEVVESKGWFLDLLEAESRKEGMPAGVAEALDTAGNRGRLLLLVDGLDEVSAERRGAARRWLYNVAERWPRARIVVTSRPIPYEPLGGGFVELEIKPLGPEARVDLVAKHLAHGEKPTEEELGQAREHLEKLRRDAWLWEWAGNPLYLGFFALLLRQGETPSHQRHALYAQIIDLLLRCDHRPGTEGVSPRSTVRQLLSVLAYEMTEGNETEMHRDRLDERLLSEDQQMSGLRKKLKAAREAYRDDVLTVFEDLERTGLLAPYARPYWRFLHRTFREALTAQHLSTWAKSADGMHEILERASRLSNQEDQARWAEPFALLAGQVRDRDGLVTALVRANRQLGLRALRSSYDLRSETVILILNEMGKHSERAEVFRALPQVLGDGKAVFALVERLRHENRSGDDLFWLDWVVRQVGRNSEALESQAASLLNRLFDHIPAPPAGLFAEVTTPLDGRTPLWREIPAGEFWMGSSAREELGRNDEHPQQRVVLRTGFRIAAVPVTQVQYAAFDPNHRSYEFEEVSKEELEHHPVNRVTWYGAVAFCRWLSQAFPETAGARLPTEKEWEYACRAGTETAYWNGDGEEKLEQVGWYDKNSERRTHRVGEKPANPWGLYDMHGNVREWTLSAWTDHYSERTEGVVEDPEGVSVVGEVGNEPGSVQRVVRGGSYQFGASRARSAARSRYDPGYEGGLRGFRVVLPLSRARDRRS